MGANTGSSTGILRNRRQRHRRQARKTARRFKFKQPFAGTKCSKPSGDSKDRNVNNLAALTTGGRGIFLSALFPFSDLLPPCPCALCASKV